MKDKMINLVLAYNNNGGNFATACKVSNMINLYTFLNDQTSGIISLKSANVCNSYKEAQEIADHWNECYKANGTYNAI